MAGASSSSETELPPPTPGRERVPTSPVVSEADPKDEAGYGSAAASGSGDVSQPAGRSYGRVYTFRIGSFNCGAEMGRVFGMYIALASTGAKWVISGL